MAHLNFLMHSSSYGWLSDAAEVFPFHLEAVVGLMFNDFQTTDDSCSIPDDELVYNLCKGVKFASLLITVMCMCEHVTQGR